MTCAPLLVKKLVEHAVPPTRKTEHAAGYDLSSSCDCVIPPGGRLTVPTGISLRVPGGTYGRIAPRSGLAVLYGINVLAGVIDEDFRGEVRAILHNTGDKDFVIKRGDRIAQLVIETIITPNVAIVIDFGDGPRSATDRGERGFGSTGV